MREHVKTNMFEKLKQLPQLRSEEGVTNRLTMLTNAKYDFELSKTTFWGLFQFKI